MTNDGRYRKSDGLPVGDSPSIHKLGDKYGWSGGDEVIERCEAIELSNYAGELQVIEDAMQFNLGTVNVGKFKSLEQAQKVSSLILQIKAAMESGNENRAIKFSVGLDETTAQGVWRFAKKQFKGSSAE